MGDLMQPGPHRLLPRRFARFARQDYENRLESIFGVVVVAQGPLATPSTIGPCLSTKAEKASASPDPA